MTALSTVSAIISLLSAVTGLIAFGLECRRDGKLGSLSRLQSAALTVTLILTAVVAGVIAQSERKEQVHTHTDTRGTRESAPLVPAPTTNPPPTATTTTIAKGQDDGPRVPPKPSLHIASDSGASADYVRQELARVLSPARRRRSAITGTLSRGCRADHAFASAWVCHETLSVTIRDLLNGENDGATLTGEAVDFREERARADARKNLAQHIAQRFGEHP